MAESKRMKYLLEQTSSYTPMPVDAAVKRLKNLEGGLPANIPAVKFDQTVELAFKLGVDPKQADQMIRGSIVLPNGIGKEQRVLVFARGDALAAAEAAGADYAGGPDLAEKIKEGWTDFDVAIASPDMMGVVGPLGRVLGPRGLMPSPRAGTVTPNVADAVREYKAGKVPFKVNKEGVVHVVVGRMSFTEENLSENARAMIGRIESMKPATSKGIYMRSVYLSATMMPSIQIAL
ncbi:50S ribosomal protein L1 [Alienimonas chondri]|uniref:Large ribosomal subunit protein uL1 n=1 Tax=Alienimonas chondri TaxID=2681879 RepID=A0ABX1VAT4_9PLAN|nr:50S ribosomal protein L1 [Alienimonas chondri]NNJ25169.1 50S ribosomal protein L1 [Alienimonas chondri]